MCLPLSLLAEAVVEPAGLLRVEKEGAVDLFLERMVEQVKAGIHDGGSCALPNFLESRRGRRRGYKQLRDD